jgi:uncharacterized protein (TIGR03083 family)
MTDNAPSSLPRDVADLMNRVRHEWSALLQAVETAGQEQMCRPGSGGWSVKDVLAHLAEWEQFVLLSQFHGYSAHEALRVDEAMLESPNFDELNAVQVERNRDRPVADVLANLHQVHSQLVAALEQMSESDFTKPVAAIFKGAPLINVIKVITYDHYSEHIEMIGALLDA